MATEKQGWKTKDSKGGTQTQSRIGMTKEQKKKGHPRGWVNPDPPTPDTRKRKGHDICGAKRSGRSTSGEGICCQPAGWGTTHVGFGLCKLHGGNTPAGTINATKQRIAKAMPTYGAPIAVGPHEAILQEVHRTAGHVQWLHEMIQWLGQEDDQVDDDEFEDVGIMPKGREATLTTMGIQGIKISVWLEMYREERVHLVNVCKAAVTMGCAERTVQIAEDQGKMLAMVVLAIFKDVRIGMSAEQISVFPEVAREHLTAVSTQPILEVTATESA